MVHKAPIQLWNNCVSVYLYRVYWSTYTLCAHCIHMVCIFWYYITSSARQHDKQILQRAWQDSTSSRQSRSVQRTRPPVRFHPNIFIIWVSKYCLKITTINSSQCVGSWYGDDKKNRAGWELPRYWSMKIECVMFQIQIHSNIFKYILKYKPKDKHLFGTRAAPVWNWSTSILQPGLLQTDPPNWENPYRITYWIHIELHIEFISDYIWKVHIERYMIYGLSSRVEGAEMAPHKDILEQLHLTDDTRLEIGQLITLMHLSNEPKLGNWSQNIDICHYGIVCRYVSLCVN